MSRNFPTQPDFNPLETTPLIAPHPGIDPLVEISGEITAWYLSKSDEFAAGDLLYQITWPGLVIDVSAEKSGMLVRILAKLRDPVEPGQQIALVRLTSTG